MSDESSELMAEPAVAERDKKTRAELRRIVGTSSKKAKAVCLMDGTKSQVSIQKETGINQGDLSVLVKLLREGKLLSGDKKEPRLVIELPKNFFEAGEE
jgi:predicted transcriptional regulator